MDYKGCLLTVGILVVLIIGPMMLAKAVSPVAGLVAALVALPAWYYLSPRPFRHMLHFFVFLLGVGMIVGVLGACIGALARR